MSPTGNDTSTAREGSEPRLLLEYSPPCRHSESTNSLASDSAAARLLAWTNLVVKKPTALPSPTAQSMPRPEIVILKCGIVKSEEHTSELQSLMRISYAVFCLNKTNSIWYSVICRIHSLSCT